jgi:hypothetical protein
VATGVVGIGSGIDEKSELAAAEQVFSSILSSVAVYSAE